jgi:hypothetical protein
MRTTSPTPAEDAFTVTYTAPSGPTATPPGQVTPGDPGVVKSAALSNLFLTRQGAKLPPATCLGGTDSVIISSDLTTKPSGLDKHGDPRRVGGFSFTLKYDHTKVCVEILPGSIATGGTNPMQCTVQDSRNSGVQGVATIFCVTSGKNQSYPANVNNLNLAQVIVRPQPDIYSLIKPNNGNGQAVQLINMSCKVTDMQGDPIPQSTPSCTDADVTIRYLEGDVEPDCSIDGLDTQAIAFRWSAPKGSLLYNDRLNLQPPPPAFDNIIDVNDLQFVYGRYVSTCDDPWPDQPPVNPKE